VNRRGFLALLAGAVLDPERLLWRPGARLISIPAPAPAPARIQVCEILTPEVISSEVLRMIQAHLIDMSRINFHFHRDAFAFVSEPLGDRW
jgi:hypothetical protein